MRRCLWRAAGRPGAEPLSRFSGVLLDMNGTFMFGEDRFCPDQDYYATYSRLGGRHLAPAAVREAILACHEHMSGIYEDPARCDSFPQVREVLALLPTSCDLPVSELLLLERVIAAHELGRVPERYAAALRGLARTHRLGIVCNLWSSKAPWLAELARVGVLDLLSTAVFSSDGSSMKPSPALFERAVRAMQLPRSEILFVGDSLRCDIGGATAAGLASVWIDHQGRGCPTADPRPDWIVRDLLELLGPCGSGGAPDETTAGGMQAATLPAPGALSASRTAE